MLRDVCPHKCYIFPILQLLKKCTERRVSSMEFMATEILGSSFKCCIISISIHQFPSNFCCSPIGRPPAGSFTSHVELPFTWTGRTAVDWRPRCVNEPSPQPSPEFLGTTGAAGDSEPGPDLALSQLSHRPCRNFLSNAGDMTSNGTFIFLLFIYLFHMRVLIKSQTKQTRSLVPNW